MIVKVVLKGVRRGDREDVRRGVCKKVFVNVVFKYF